MMLLCPLNSAFSRSRRPMAALFNKQARTPLPAPGYCSPTRDVLEIPASCDLSADAVLINPGHSSIPRPRPTRTRLGRVIITMQSLTTPASVSKRKQACKSCRQRKRRCDVCHTNSTPPHLNTTLISLRENDLRAPYARNGDSSVNMQSLHRTASVEMSLNTPQLCSGDNLLCPLNTGPKNCPV
jgi:hypothetical protein